MITASVYGRLGADPIERQTKNSKAMTTATVAVDAARHGADADTVWFGLVAFGRAAEALARHVKGDLIACMGTLYRNHYTARDGQEREGWSLNVEAIVSARTVRSGGGRKHTETAKAAPAGASAGNGAPFNDPIPSGVT